MYLSFKINFINLINYNHYYYINILCSKCSITIYYNLIIFKLLYNFILLIIRNIQLLSLKFNEKTLMLTISYYFLLKFTNFFNIMILSLK